MFCCENRRIVNRLAKNKVVKWKIVQHADDFVTLLLREKLTKFPMKEKVGKMFQARKFERLKTASFYY